MKICFLSDTHLFLRGLQLPDADLLVHSGDFLSWGTLAEFNREVEVINDVANKFKHGMICTAGNHDIIIDNQPALCKSMLNSNVKMLLNEPYELEGLKFYGSPYTPKFGTGWGFQLNDVLHQKHCWDLIPDDVDILITHGAPYKILDEVLYPSPPDYDENVGDKVLLETLSRLKQLKIHTFGHLHLQGSQTKEVNGVRFINASTCDDEYIPHRKPIVVEIVDGVVTLLP